MLALNKNIILLICSTLSPPGGVNDFFNSTMKTLAIKVFHDPDDLEDEEDHEQEHEQEGAEEGSERIDIIVKQSHTKGFLRSYNRGHRPFLKEYLW